MAERSERRIPVASLCLHEAEDRQFAETCAREGANRGELLRRLVLDWIAAHVAEPAAPAKPE